MSIYPPLKASTELGIEKRCCSCGEFWPADVEFFNPMPSARDKLTPRCIACIKAGLWQFPPVQAGDYRDRWRRTG